MEYRHGDHTKTSIQYHFVWVTKYRYKMLQGDVAVRIRELIRQTCKAGLSGGARGVVMGGLLVVQA